MPEYIKTNRPGHTLENAIERTNGNNAVIVKYEGGLRKKYIEWSPLTEQMFRPKTDPRYFRRKTIVMRAGEEVVEKDVPPDMLTANMNPFVQIIYRIVQRGGITSHEDIVRALLTEERVFSASDKNAVDVIEGILGYMNRREYYLLQHDGRLKVGFELPKSYHLVEYKRGYDPFEYHIMRLADGHGMVSRDEIYGYITDYLGWLKTLTKIDMYLDRLVERGNLKKIQRNYFQYAKPLESNK